MRSLVVAEQSPAQREECRRLLAPVKSVVAGMALLSAACSYLAEAGDPPLAVVGATTPPSAAFASSAAGSAAPIVTPAATTPEDLSRVPDLLSQTGLYSDTASRVLAADVEPF